MNFTCLRLKNGGGGDNDEWRIANSEGTGAGEVEFDCRMVIGCPSRAESPMGQWPVVRDQWPERHGGGSFFLGSPPKSAPGELKKTSEERALQRVCCPRSIGTVSPSPWSSVASASASPYAGSTPRRRSGRGSPWQLQNRGRGFGSRPLFTSVWIVTGYNRPSWRCAFG